MEEPIVWDNSFAVGIPLIDNQHRRLFELAEVLRLAIVQQDATGNNDNSVLSSVIQQLFEYTAHHFQSEEVLQGHVGYPQRHAHSQLHRQFEDRLGQWHKELLNETLSSDQVFLAIRDWLWRHVRVSDRRIAEFCRKNGMDLDKLTEMEVLGRPQTPTAISPSQAHVTIADSETPTSGSSIPVTRKERSVDIASPPVSASTNRSATLNVTHPSALASPLRTVIKEHNSQPGSPSMARPTSHHSTSNSTIRSKVSAVQRPGAVAGSTSMDSVRSGVTTNASPTRSTGLGPFGAARRGRRGSTSSMAGSDGGLEGGALGALLNQSVLRSVLSNIPVGIVVANDHGTIRAFSPVAKRMFLYEPWEAVGENLTMLMEDAVGRRHDFYLSRCRKRMNESLAKMTTPDQDPEGDRTVITLADLPFLGEEELSHAQATIESVPLFGGVAREQHAVDKSGRAFPVEIRLTSCLMEGELHFVGYFTDIRGTTQFQELSVRQDKLLSSMYNQQVLSRMLLRNQVLDTLEDCTVLTLRIEETDRMMRKLDGIEAVAMLKEMYTLLDNVLGTHQVIEKVHTTGDTFVAVCGAPMPVLDHASHMVRAGLDMLDAVQQYNTCVLEGQSILPLLFTKAERRRMHRTSALDVHHKLDWRKVVAPIKVRVGVHSGSACGGVLSKQRALYDIVGEVVNGSHSMMMAAELQTVHLSHETFDRLSSDLRRSCLKRDNMTVRGIEGRTTYQAVPKISEGDTTGHSSDSNTSV